MVDIKQYTVYRVTNILNNKVYIGFTTHFQRRYKAHYKRSKTSYFSLFYSAIRKYGWENFKWEILYVLEDEMFAKEMEKYCIKIHNSYENGYNLTIGGEGTFGWNPSENTRKMWSQQRKNKGHLHTEEYKKSIQGIGNPFYGKKHSEETRIKMSLSRKGKPRKSLSEETKRKISESNKRTKNANNIRSA